MAPQWDEGSVGERRLWRRVDGSGDPEDSFSFQHCRSEGEEKLNQKSKETQNKDTKEGFCYRRDERKRGQKRPRARLDQATL